MDAIFDHEWTNAELFNSCSLIYVHCCDFDNTFSFTVPSLPFLKLSGLFAHFSFWDSPSERRMSILPLSRELLQKLDGWKSPVVVDVQSGVIFEFQPDESEEENMLLIWDFSVNQELSEKATPQQPHLPSVETLPMAPLLDVEKVRKAHGCNCSTFPVSNDVFVNIESRQERQVDVDSNGSEIASEELFSGEEYHSPHEDSDEEISDDETTHTLGFKCIGAAHEKERQEFLKTASQKSKERELKVKLRPEPTNEKDKNAIAIDINHGNGFFHFSGYIASELTQYLHPLIVADKIVDVSLEHIQFRVSFARMGYYPKVLITRKGAWEKFVMYRCRSAI